MASKQFDFTEKDYSHQIEFNTEPMPSHRSQKTRCEENDFVQVFDTPEGLLAIGFGFRNTGFYLGVVMMAGAPIGFGKVFYLANNIGIVRWARYPIPETDSDRDEDELDNEQSLQLTES